MYCNDGIHILLNTETSSSFITERPCALGAKKTFI